MYCCNTSQGARASGETGVILGVSGAMIGPNKGPVLGLPGNNDRNMSSFNIQVNFGKAGNISNIKYNNKTFSVENWNKQFRDIPTTGKASSHFE